jgi:hypothetical protein
VRTLYKKPAVVHCESTIIAIHLFLIIATFRHVESADAWRCSSCGHPTIARNEAAPLQEVFFYERIQINHLDELMYKILPYSIHGEM